MKQSKVSFETVLDGIKGTFDKASSLSMENKHRLISEVLSQIKILLPTRYNTYPNEVLRRAVYSIEQIILNNYVGIWMLPVPCTANLAIHEEYRNIQLREWSNYVAGLLPGQR